MAVYDLQSSSVVGDVQTGDTINCPYTGESKSLVLPAGRYRFQCWGAQGGYRSSSTYGGKGGYSVGEITLQEDTTVYLYAGGEGNTEESASSSSTVIPGGFNGGGDRNRYPGGGGGSDVRIETDDLNARVIVAGGGGSCGASSKGGGYGGGESGQTRTESYGSGGGGGTQTSGGSGGSDNIGTFGKGGQGRYRSSGYGGAGGGGWYGGGGVYPDSSGDDDRGGGGGSGFVWTGENAPPSYLLGPEYYLTNANTYAGNTSFESPTGGNETGHAGSGYIRVTALEVFPRTPDPPADFQQTSKDYFSIGLQWSQSENATGYKLYRDGTQITQTKATSYTDNAVQPYTTYVYSVVAYNEEGDSDPTYLTASTTEGYAQIMPSVDSASISPNPAHINQYITISVSVSEDLILLDPVWFYSGQIYSGEV